MSYALKYKLPFKSVWRIDYELQILEDGYTGSTTEIKGGVDPVIIEYPTQERFTPILPSGMIINLLSEYDRQFIDLYSNNIQKYKIILKMITNINTSIIWRGYLNTELYSEDFSQSKNYNVQFTANDGFKVLERIPYLDKYGNKYEGIESNFSVIVKILSKIDIDYNYIFFSSSTKIYNKSTGYDKTLLHHTFVNNQNWYDEDNEAFNCKKVIEEILKPYGLIIQQINGDYYITDYNNITFTGNYTFFKRYTKTGVYETTYSANLIKDVNNIGVYDSNISFNYINGINKQIINYNQYNLKDIIELDVHENVLSNLSGEVVQMDDEVFSNASSKEWVQRTIIYPYHSGYKLPFQFNSEYIKLAQAIPTGSDVVNNRSEMYLLYKKEIGDWQNDFNPIVVFENNDTIYLHKNQTTYNYYLKIEAEAFFRNSDQWGGNSDLKDNKDFKIINIRLLIKVGDLYYSNFGEWSTTPAHFIISFYEDELKTHIADKWVKSQPFKPIVGKSTPNYGKDILIPLNGVDTGKISVFLLRGYRIYDGISTTSPIKTDSSEDARLRQLKVSLFNDNENIKDIEYIGILDDKWINSKPTIKNLIGCNIYGYPAQFSSILDINYNNITEFERDNKVASIEKLLLNSYTSNYEKQTINININLHNNNFYSPLECLTYNSQLPNITFFQQGKKINFKQSMVNCDLIEIKKDNLNLI